MSKRKGLFLLLQVLLVLVLVPAASAATTYTVRAGDSLWTIARRYHTTVEALKAANGLKSDALQIGDRLSIPAAASGATAAPAAGGSNGAGFTGSHTVRAGDSLWAIARRCNTTVAALKAANGLTSDALQIGDRLKVPAARVGAASAPAAAAPPPARPVVAPSRDAAGVGLARDIIATGMQYLGVDYDYGGASPSGFDCSGFIMYICKQHGVNLPHSSRAMSGMGTPVARSELQPGDLVFFRTLGSSSINHVGMYVGNNQFIHANIERGITVMSLDGYYDTHYAGARRVF